MPYSGKSRACAMVVALSFGQHSRVIVMERRKHQRTAISINLRIEAPGTICHGIARDISTRGIFIELDQGSIKEQVRDIALHFEIDTGMQVLSRKLSGKLVRNEGDGLAVRFAEHDILGRAVVHELMYYMQLSQQEAMPAECCTHDKLHGSPGDRAA